jgi:hypothetical protein
MHKEEKKWNDEKHEQSKKKEVHKWITWMVNEEIIKHKQVDLVAR